ncbi:CheR family methyltransferase [Teredinibacter haidensis]|uniref:CheR family methyltransferase n=1 Tax=Teredinibacter haidensis TaxID=2731755 RepID=UPI0009FB7D37|nr:protein-glutamate O-methyltransferase CheR [Teredinibacter haidensis]
MSFNTGTPTSAFTQGRVQLDTREFQEFRDFLQTVAGIDLGHNKQYLVATRIRRILIDYECETLGVLTKLIKNAANREVRQKVIDAMTTNETFWFRDGYPFEYLRKTVLPEMVENNRGGRFRIWSAACSSGQEPYSLSIVAEEYIRGAFGISNLPLDIVATDLSSQILDNAKRGEYDRLSITRGLSEQRLRDYFDHFSSDCWRVKPPIGRRVTFKPLNLQDSYLLLGKFDVIFCRNVLIYFSADLKRDILTRMHAVMKPGGYLFLGSSESIAGTSDLFEMIHCNPGVVYKAK